MKSFFTTFILILTLFNLNSYSQSAWFFSNPTPQNNTLNSVDFADANTGFTVGDYGMILKTTNGGINWKSQSNPTILAFLRQVFCFNANTVLACGYAGVTAKTTDGNNWILHQISSAALLFGIVMPAPDTAYTAGESGKIFKSVNGGENWFPLNSGTNEVFFAIDFFNANTGTVTGANGVILKTTNGGVNWSAQTSPANNLSLLSVFYVNANTAFIGGGNIDNINQGFIMKTTNGGANWNFQVSGLPGTIYKVEMHDSNNGIACGQDGYIYTTTNGGSNWIQRTGGTNFSLNSITYADAENIVTVGYLGITLKSVNSGLNWNTLSVSATYNNLNSITFTDLNTGYSAGFNGTIIKTTNSGSTYITQNAGTSRNLNCVSFSDSQNGFIAGDTGLICITTNSGNNWTVQTSGTSQTLNSIVAINSQTAIAAGNSGTILKTTNGGTSWSRITSGTIKNLSAVSFMPGSSTGMIVGMNGIILKSTDQGSSWISLKFPEPFDWSDVKMVSDNIAYILVPGSACYKTTNSGANWDRIFLNEPTNFYKLSFLNPENGFITGGGFGGGNIVRTTNGGLNWIAQFINTPNRISDVAMLTNDIAITAGWNGTMLKTTSGGFPVGIKNTNSFAVEDFKLYQNYPNPFNPNTIIKYEISKPEIVLIKVYDMLGKEIATLVNKKQNSGTYEIAFDGSSLSSGIYFYSLFKDGLIAETKKMILVR